ncbi:MAG TPA: alpha/beta hydrolase, partial [Puia sp.]
MRKKWWLLIPVFLVILYFAGPHPSKPVYSPEQPVAPAEPAALENYIRSKEAAHRLKPDNEARIVWADSTRRKTPYVIVYLHGFSASQGEGDPVHHFIASKYGCNLYLPRLAEHGIDTVDAM